MINYKSNLIKSYINAQKYIEILIFMLKKKLGTSGCLSILDKKKISENFFVTNSDILIKSDLTKIYDYHIKNKNILTIVVCNYKTQLSYGNCITNKRGDLIKIQEITFNNLINTGLYILNKKSLSLLKKNKYSDFNTFIQNCIKKK